MDYNNYNQGMPMYNQGMPMPIQRQVGFQEAIERGFHNYCNFKGRASRSEFWFWSLFAFLVGIGASIVDAILGTEGLIGFMATIALFLPGLGLACRRLHDIGKAAGWIFIGLIPLVGAILLIIWYCQPSQMQPNRFGDVPNLVR